MASLVKPEHAPVRDDLLEALKKYTDEGDMTFAELSSVLCYTAGQMFQQSGVTVGELEYAMRLSRESVVHGYKDAAQNHGRNLLHINVAGCA